MKGEETSAARGPGACAMAGKRKQSAVASIPMDHDLERALQYLLARAGMRMDRAFRRELHPFGLSLAEWRVCAALRQKAHQRLAELATHTSTEPSTLSRTVEGLLQRGLLVRDRSGDDARALALSLTPDGDALAQRIIPLAQLFDRVALSGVTAAQVDLLRDVLRRVCGNMEALEGVGGAAHHTCNAQPL
jgi:DNA-binding MarR family transcriptional regulator